MSQVLGCRVSAPGRPCRDMAPGPRCSGPGSVLGVPTLLPWTLPATPCTGTVPTDTGGTKGRDCHRCDEQWCHTGQRCALTQPWGLWLGCGGTGWHCPSTSLCHSPRARVAWCQGWTHPELEPALGMAAGGDLARWGLWPPPLCLRTACVLSCPHRHARSGGAWISISLFIRGVNTPV